MSLIKTDKIVGERFSFHVDDVEITELTDHIYMCFQRCRPSIERFFFTNNNDELIDTPNNFAIYDNTNHEKVKRLSCMQYALI